MPWVRDCKAQITSAERLQTRSGLVWRRIAFRNQSGAEFLETLFGDRRQQLSTIGEVMIGRARRDADARRQFPQVQRVDPGAGDHFDRSVDERPPEASMMVVFLPCGPDRSFARPTGHPPQLPTSAATPESARAIWMPRAARTTQPKVTVSPMTSGRCSRPVTQPTPLTAARAPMAMPK